MINFVISPEKTAITNGVSLSTKLLEKSYKKYMRVLDYGSGKLRNYKYLLSKDLHFVDVLDTPLQTSKYRPSFFKGNTNCYNSIEEITYNYDRILCSFVLNVVDLHTRIKIIKDIEQLLEEEGKVFIEVRTYKDLENTKTKEIYEDGFLIGKGKVRTFQKPFTEDELELFISEHTSLKVVEKIKKTNSIIIILNK